MKIVVFGLGIALGVGTVTLQRPLAAQPLFPSLFTIARADFTRSEGVADAAGVVFLNAVNAPVRSEEGAVVGFAHLTSVLEHPVLAYLPTFGEVRSGSRRFFFGRLVSRDARVRRAFAFEESGGQPFSFFRVAMVQPVELPAGDTPFVFTIGPEPGSAPGLTFNHVFDFTSPRTQSIVSVNQHAFRPSAEWSIAGSGVKQRIGTNFSFNYANSAQSGSANYLRIDDNNGAVVFCAGTTCGVAGVGGFDGLYGRAISRTAGEFAVSGDAASTTEFTFLTSGSQPGLVACPPTFVPPAPNGVLGTNRVGVMNLSWESVPCAVAYDVQVEDRLLGRQDVVNYRVSTTNLRTTIPLGSVVRVAAVTAAGVRSAFTDVQLVHIPLQL